MPARDEGVNVVTPRTLIRRVVADLEYLGGVIQGQINVDKAIGSYPGHPENGTTLAERLEASRHLITQLMDAAQITEDEDLDD